MLIITIGASVPIVAPRSLSTQAYPSIFGMLTSMMNRSNRLFRAASTASRPLTASLTSNPAGASSWLW